MIKNKQDGLDTEKSNEDIIDTILGSKGSQSDELSTISNDCKVITAKEFFTDNGGDGFISKQGFLKLLSTQSRNELNCLEALLELMNEGAKINAPSYIKKDSYNRDCIFCVNKQKRGDREFKFLVAENLRMFLGLYQFGIIKCQLSLRSLYEEAHNLALVQSDGN